LTARLRVEIVNKKQESIVAIAVTPGKSKHLVEMLIQSFVGAAIESATNGKDSDKKRDAYVEFLSVFFAFLIAFIILGFVGKLLWNGVIVELFTIAKPAKSFWQIIGLMIFAMLIKP